MVTAEQLEKFRATLEAAQNKELARLYPSLPPPSVRVKTRAKYACVDIGSNGGGWSGKYMVVLATGEIFGIKAYGVIHRGHPYGTVDTIHEWDWSGYEARRLKKEVQHGPILPAVR